MILPLRDMQLSEVTGARAFGMRTHPIYKTQKLHDGIDVPKPTGTPVYAVDNGVCIVSKMQGNGRGYGNYVVIRHNAYFSLSAHLSRRAVRQGQSILEGDIIGYIGSTGDSTGPHLHFGLCKAYNPGAPDKSNWFDPLSKLREASEVTTQEIVVEMNGKETKLKTILYENENYMRIRDLAEAQKDDKLEVDWDAARKKVVITSK